MKRRTRFKFSDCLLTALFFLLLLPLCESQVYRITKLPTLTGQANGKNPDRAYGINKSGQVTGVSSSEAVVWTPGSGLEDLGPDPCVGCVPVGGINDSGDAVGLVDSGGFLWTQSGGLQILGQAAQPSGVNDSDQVTGSFSA